MTLAAKMGFLAPYPVFEEYYAPSVVVNQIYCHLSESEKQIFHFMLRTEAASLPKSEEIWKIRK